ncbi:hypothetical protein RF55_7210 [Lasius niger]|uniref:Uncharacterized protein n=1 Tax=Lasius niger TaxID=67767 RepID=A0A0J7KQU6_LASNI|nr:hypothetical protein RF55_7210 [Lasius niger]
MMELTLKKLLVTKDYIDRFWENLIKIGKDKVTQSYLKTRLTLLESYWQRFEETHYNLLENDDAAVEKYLNEDVYADTEDNYVAVKTRITSLLRDDTTSVKHDSTIAASLFFKQIQLPKISLPSFSGDQLAWESFRDLFRSLVGDVSELAPVQKL